MRSNYKKLGDFIRRCDEFNIGMEVKELLGISNNKYFQRSHTNTIGIDLSTYRIVRTGQFAYNRATTRNGDKISIALRQGNDCIVSPSYRVFQVIDENQLLSEYLMMWFRRPEFDRYARFRSHGSAHEFFEWEEMCNVELPIPDIAKQREIVKEYNVLVNRIALNNQLIQKLEETAQAIYKQWFVDFEFPDQNGKLYKSNGGEMVESELGEIPTGWKIGCLFDLIELQRGFDLPVQNRKPGNYPIYASTGVTEKHNEYKVKSPGIVTGRSGSLGEVFYIDEDFWPLNTTLWVKNFKNATPIFTFYVLNGINIIDYNSGSAVPSLNRNHIHLHKLIVPKIEVIEKFEVIEKIFFTQIKSIKNQQIALDKFKEILLSKLATMEN